MASEINVKPVSGMTPKQIATELRIVIRDRLWVHLKGMKGSIAGGPSDPAISENHKYVLARQDRIMALTDEISMALVQLNKTASLRRPNAIRAESAQIRSKLGLLRRAVQDEVAYTNWAFIHLMEMKKVKQEGPSEQLLDAAMRAYALVQALPTIDGAPVGQAENTLRAITAMVKVYHGVEVLGTVEDLPEIMPQLLEAIKPKVVEVEPEVVVMGLKFKLSLLPTLPWRIFNGKSLMSDYAMNQTKYGVSVNNTGFYPSLVGTSAGWNHGDCDALSALKTLVGLRQRFGDKNAFILRDSNPEGYAVARVGEKMKVYNGFGDVLYHLKKECEANAKSKAAKQKPVAINF